MEHKKDIGKAIRDKLDAFDKSPGDHLWSAIESDLPKKKKRRILPFWFFLITAMVIGLWMWSGGDSNSNDAKRNGTGKPENAVTESQTGQNNSTKPATGTQPNTGVSVTDATPPSTENAANGNTANGNTAAPSTDDTSGGKSNRKAVGKNSYRQQSTRSNQVASTHQKRNIRQSHSQHSGNKTTLAKENNLQTNSASPNETEHAETKQNSNPDGVTGGIISGNIPDKAAIETTKDSVQTSIAKTDEKKPDEKPKDSLKNDEFTDGGKTFRIFLYAAPTYYNTFSKISSIDKRLDTLSRKAEITFNYGGYLCFDYDEKWSFRFGAAKTTLRHRTQNIPVSSLGQTNYYNVDYGNLSNAELQPRFANSQYFDLIQEISYLEFPIELKYKLRDGKIGIEAIGGISSSFLKANTITAESDQNGAVILGSTKDQYKWYLSANAGVGFYWQFAENFRLNVEPIFKYHFRTASTALQPYSVVVLGGIEYTFHWKSRNKKK